MSFIELHRHPDGKPRMINLAEIGEIRVSQSGEHAIVEWRTNTELAPMPVRETYTQIHGMLAVAKVLVWG